MIGQRWRASLPGPVVLAVLIAATIAVSVLISALVIDADPPPSELPGTIELVYKSSVVPAHGLARVDAQCPVGKVVTGGGTYADAVLATLLVLDNTPVRTGRRYAWRVRFSNKSARDIAAGSVAICVRAAAAPQPQTGAADSRSRTVTTAPGPGTPSTTTSRR